MGYINNVELHKMTERELEQEYSKVYDKLLKVLTVEGMQELNNILEIERRLMTMVIDRKG